MSHLALEELEEGRVYALRSRNIRYGVWRPEKQDFVGIRKKFESRFLDSEYYEHTAYPLAPLNEVVPPGVPVNEYKQTIDSVSGRPVDFDRPIANGGRGWFFLDGDGEASEDIRAVTPMNTPLFDFLDEIERRMNPTEEAAQ